MYSTSFDVGQNQLGPLGDVLRTLGLDSTMKL